MPDNQEETTLLESNRIMSPEEQLRRWVNGELVHNGKSRSVGECLPDFSCCNPDMLWSKELREKFVNAVSDEERTGMLMMSLSSAFAALGDDTKVHITDGVQRSEH